MCLTHENGKDDAEMEQLYLMPGEERYTKFRDENGVPKIRYTYCSPARQAVQLRVPLNR